MEPKRRYSRQRIDVVGLLVGDECLFDQVDAGFAFEVEVASDQRVQTSTLFAAVGFDQLFKHWDFVFASADTKHREIQSAAVDQRVFVHDPADEFFAIHLIFHRDEIFVRCTREFIERIKRQNRLFVFEKILEKDQSLSA